MKLQISVSATGNRILDGAMKLAEKQAANSKDCVLKHNGETYTLTFNQREWHYKVTDSEGNFIVNLNVKTPAKAKAELKKWLDS